MRLQNAMKETEDEFDFKPISWQPFMLNATIPAEGYTSKEYFAKKGITITDERIASWAADMKPTADSLGISFKSGRMMYNTRQSHRLFEWTSENKPEIMKTLPQVLFKSYFSDGNDISNIDVLVGIAKEAGMTNVSDVEAMLRDEKMKPSNEHINNADRFSKRDLDVSGVPNFIINGVQAFSGAQPEATFIRMFRHLKANRMLIRK